MGVQPSVKTPASFKAPLCMTDGCSVQLNLVSNSRKHARTRPDGPRNFPKVAVFEEFLGKPTLQSRTGMTGPSSQGWVEAMSRGALKPP